MSTAIYYLLNVFVIYYYYNACCSLDCQLHEGRASFWFLCHLLGPRAEQCLSHSNHLSVKWETDPTRSVFITSPSLQGIFCDPEWKSTGGRRGETCFWWNVPSPFPMASPWARDRHPYHNLAGAGQPCPISFLPSLDVSPSSSRDIALHCSSFCSLTTLQPLLPRGRRTPRPVCPELRLCTPLSPLQWHLTVASPSSSQGSLSCHPRLGQLSPLSLPQKHTAALPGSTAHRCYFSFVCLTI